MMKGEPWSRIQSLFEQALEVPLDGREAFLDQACGRHPKLRRQIARMVTADAEAASFMEEPAIEQHAHQLALSAPEDHEVLTGPWGRFEIVKPLGEGGMGAVFLARQTSPIERMVAIKFIREELAGRESVLRFQAERQALARMSHPNIAQVFDAGVSDGGRHFLVMEYLPGTPLTVFCDEHRLTVNERLRLFASVCAGAHHLHQRAVIHRDLKPSNILVTEIDGEPTPKIIDFGIAKGLDRPLIEDTPRTEGVLIGTPSYLSPEAILATEGDADVDTRTDVYSLGVLLYELLAGKLPFGTGPESVRERLRDVLNIVPPTPAACYQALAPPEKAIQARQRRTNPSSLARTLRGELGWITGTAMALERDDRYASATQLQSDVLAYLAGEPVLAGPPSSIYRLQKFVTRHLVGLASASAVVIALGFGLYLRTLEAKRANHEAQRAGREAMALQEVVDFMVGMFESSDPTRPGAGSTMTVRELLDRGEQSIQRGLGHQPLVQAKLMETIASVNYRLGNYQRGTVMMETALAIRRQHRGPDALELARSLESLAAAHITQENFAEADALLQEALAIKQQRATDDDLLLVPTLDGLAKLKTATGDFETAELLLRQNLATMREQDIDKGENLVSALKNLAALCSSQARYAEADRYFRQVLEIERQTYEHQHPVIASTLHHIAITAMNRGQPEAAGPLLEEALAIEESTLGPEHPYVASTLHGLASLHVQQGNYELVEKLETRALAILEKLHGPEHNEIALSCTTLGEAYRRIGDARSEHYFRRALTIWQKVLGPKNNMVAVGLNNLANLYFDLGRLAEAAALLEQAVEISEHAMGQDHPFTAHPISGLAKIRHQEGDLAAAANLLERALGIWKEAGYSHPSVAAAEQTLAELKVALSTPAG